MKNEYKNLQFLQMNPEVQEMSSLLSRLKTVCSISTAHLNFLLEQYEGKAIIVNDNTITLVSETLKPLTISKNNQDYTFSNSVGKENEENKENKKIQETQNWASNSWVYNPVTFYTEISQFIEA